MAVSIRPAVAADAADLLTLKLALDGESRFMMVEPGERRDTARSEAAHLRRLRGGGSVVLLAERDGAPIGYVEAERGGFHRNRHSAHVVIGVRRTAAGQGVGRALLEALDRWAAEHGLHRLELTVMAHNERAIGLYRRCGYEVEGTRRHSLRVDGAFVDELSMAKLLG